MNNGIGNSNHQIHLERLSDEVGILGTALNWYLSDKRQRVSIHVGVLSRPFDLDCGVTSRLMLLRSYLKAHV